MLASLPIKLKYDKIHLGLTWPTSRYVHLKFYGRCLI